MKEEKEIGIYEAKNKLSQLVEEAAQGNRIWITKRGKRIAQLSSGINKTEDQTPDLVEEFRKIRARGSHDGSSLKDLVEEGRK